MAQTLVLTLVVIISAGKGNDKKIYKKNLVAPLLIQQMPLISSAMRGKIASFPNFPSLRPSERLWVCELVCLKPWSSWVFIVLGLAEVKSEQGLTAEPGR